MLKKMGFISKDQKEQILKATDIVQLIEGYVQLKSSGKNFLGLCPFHQEKTPSFTVSPTYQNYKCYGCGEYGDAIRFVMEMENLQFRDSLRFLADRSGMTLNFNSSSSSKPERPTEIEKCLSESFNFFRFNLLKAKQTAEIVKYLRLRQVPEKLIETFQLGYVGKGWTNLHDLLNKKSIPTNLQDKAGLIKKGEQGGYYDRLRNRLIFPIRDHRGRTLGFAGRAIGDEKPKYLNPPETDLYKKSLVFYGIFEARSQIRKKRRAIVVEGYLDVLRLHEHSWTETVATCGTALTANHISSLKRFGAKEAFLLFDGDSSGIKAAERSARIFLENDLDSRVVVLPESLDPDDYLKKYSSDDFVKLIQDSKFDYEFIIDRAIQGTVGMGIEYQRKALEEMLQTAENLKAELKRELFLSKAAEAFNIQKKNLWKLAKINPSKTDKSHPQNVGFSFNRNELPEVKFLHYLITHGQSMNLARHHVSTSDLSHPVLGSLYGRLLQLTDEEFLSINPRELPDLFVEYSSLLLYLLHFEGEHRNSGTAWASTAEMTAMKSQFLENTNRYSEDVFNHLIKKLKKRKKSYEIERLQHLKEDHARSNLIKMVEQRKKQRPANSVKTKK